MHKIAFWLSLVFIFTIPWEAVIEYPALGSLAKLTGVAVAIVWGATVVISGRIRKPRPFHIAVFVFVLWNALSVFWSADFNSSIDHLITWAQLLVLIIILWDLYTSRDAMHAGLQMYVLGAYVVFGNTIFNYLSGTTFYYERFSATGTNPDDLGVILALGIPVAWYLGLPRTSKKIPLFLKIVNYAYIPAAFLGIALSGTRTALIAVVPGILFGLVSLTRHKLSTRIAVILLFVSAAFVLLPQIPEASLQRLGTVGNELSGGDLNGRLELWRQGLVSFEENPILGVGGNMFRSVNMEGKVAHNSFLSVLVEVGFIGFLLFGVILTLVITEAMRQAKSDSYFWLSILATWAIAASTLTWECRKPTWLFLSFVVVSSALKRDWVETEQIVRPGENNLDHIITKPIRFPPNDMEESLLG